MILYEYVKGFNVQKIEIERKGRITIKMKLKKLKGVEIPV